MSSTLCPGFGLFLCSEVVVSLDFYWCFLWLYVCGSFIFFDGRRVLFVNGRRSLL